jgi:heat shock protein beta
MESKENYREVSKLYGNALRIGMLESDKDKVKIAKLLRFESTVSNCTSLEEVCGLPLKGRLGGR